ncbi:MAG TPA: rhomboid family intramembrane serine protease [Acidobacteriota bacterium]|nr:rhomboid family intramembrane serine protease [Acidobacteriota bacterium]
MIPLRDVLRSRTQPYIVYAIIALNAIVFIYELGLGPMELSRFFFDFGVVPWKLTTPEAWGVLNPLEQLLPLLTSMFLHGGWLHIIGNLWIFYIFGDNVEDRMGRLPFLMFFLLAGLFSVGLHVLTNWGSKIPTVGASGAIAGIMGAYLVYFPYARIVTFVPILLVVVVTIPAYVFLIVWFLLQFFNGAFAIFGGGAAAEGIAWWAHIGGFLFGVAAAKIFAKPTPRRPGLSPLAKRFFS